MHALFSLSIPVLYTMAVLKFRDVDHQGMDIGSVSTSSLFFFEQMIYYDLLFIFVHAADRR